MLAGMRMRLFIAAASALASVAAPGASLEESYLLSRDAYVARFSRAEGVDAARDPKLPSMEEALKDLEAQLRRIVGAPKLQGVGPGGRIHLGTLSDDDVDFGLLDGLVFESEDGGTRIVVTTATLFAAWLRAHRQWEGSAPLPADPAAALASDDFYTQAIGMDAAISRFADLPLRRPAGVEVATAMLAAERQDIGPTVPRSIVVAQLQADRLLLVRAPVRARVAAIPACDAVWSEYEGRAEAAHEAYRASGLKDDARFEEYTRLQDQGDGAFRRCFGEQAKRQPFFPELLRQAQELADGLPTP